MDRSTSHIPQVFRYYQSRLSVAEKAFHLRESLFVSLRGTDFVLSFIPPQEGPGKGRGLVQYSTDFSTNRTRPRDGQ